MSKADKFTSILDILKTRGYILTKNYNLSADEEDKLLDLLKKNNIHISYQYHESDFEKEECVYSDGFYESRNKRFEVICNNDLRSYDDVDFIEGFKRLT